MTDNKPVQLRSSKWLRASTKTEPPKPGSGWVGGYWYKGYQKGAGGSNNSDPAGNKRRWYFMRAFRKSLGKHGIKRLQDKLMGKQQDKFADLKTKAHGKADLIKGLDISKLT